MSVGILSMLVLLCLANSIVKHPVNALSADEIQQFYSQTYTESNTNLQGTVSVSVSASDSQVLLVSSNGIPDHATGTFPGQGNPNSITAQAYNWKLPNNPAPADATTCLPMGPIGMAVNGVAIYNPYTITCCNAGVALDGYPIYGPNDENGNQLTASDVDECNGKTDSNGNYRYHILNEFPYFLGCFKGTVRNDVGQGITITTTCQCTTPVAVCTEFGRKRRKRQTSTFTCCDQSDTCNTSRLESVVNVVDSGSLCQVVYKMLLVTAVTSFFLLKD